MKALILDDKLNQLIILYSYLAINDRIINLNQLQMHGTLQFRSNATDQPTVTLGVHGQSSSKENSTKKQHRRIAQNSDDLNQIKNKYMQEIQIYTFEIESLKEHIEVQEQEKEELQNIITTLKKELATVSKQSSRLFQDNQRNRQLVQKLKIDNKSMEMEIDKFRSERKVYYNNLNNIQLLKRDISQKMADKSNTLEEISSKYRKLQRTHLQSTLKIQELQRNLKEVEEERKQLHLQIKDSLQRYLASSNLTNRLEYQLREVNELNKNLKDKVYDLQKEKQQFMAQLGYSQNENSLSESNSSNYPTHQRSMVQIQSYMKEIQNLLDLKRDQTERKKKNYDKLKISIQCLEKSL